MYLSYSSYQFKRQIFSILILATLTLGCDENETTLNVSNQMSSTVQNLDDGTTVFSDIFIKTSPPLNDADIFDQGRSSIDMLSDSMDEVASPALDLEVSPSLP